MAGNSALNTTTPPRIAIIGGGTAGLTCAYRLAQAGVNATIYEIDTVIGGRMVSQQNFMGTQKIELGGEFIDEDQDAIQALARELGLTLLNLHDDSLQDNQRWMVYQGQRVNLAAYHEDLNALAALVRQTMRGILTASIRYDQPHRAAALDIPLSAWLDQHGVTGVARAVVERAMVGEFGRELDELSALCFLTQPIDISDYFAPRETGVRYVVAEGSGAIPARLAAHLPTPVALGVALVAMRETSDGRLVLTFQRGATVTDETFDFAVLTLPFTMLRRLDLSKVPLRAAKRRAIAELGYGTNAKLMLGFTDRSAWRMVGSIAKTSSDQPYQQLWETSRAQTGNEGILTNYYGGKRGVEIAHEPEADHAASVVAQLSALYPTIEATYAGQHARKVWAEHPHTLGSYSCYLPGQFTTLRGVEGEPEGRLLFAGEHTSIDFQGYMNGAVETGERAAQEVLARVGYGAKSA